MNDFLLYFLSIDKEITPLFSNSHIFTIVIICGRFKLKWSKKKLFKKLAHQQKNRETIAILYSNKNNSVYVEIIDLTEIGELISSYCFTETMKCWTNYTIVITIFSFVFLQITDVRLP